VEDSEGEDALRLPSDHGSEEDPSVDVDGLGNGYSKGVAPGRSNGVPRVPTKGEWNANCESCIVVVVVRSAAVSTTTSG